MKYREFKSIMQVLEFEDVIYTPLGNKGYLQDIYLLRDCAVYCSNNQAVITGRIPLSLATNIWEHSCDDSIYSIRIGDMLSGNPRMYAVDDIYEKEIIELRKRNLEDSDYINKCREATERLQERSDDGKYIKEYHISDKEDFAFFLAMMKNYYNENNKSISNAVVFQKK